MGKIFIYSRFFQTWRTFFSLPPLSLRQGCSPNYSFIWSLLNEYMHFAWHQRFSKAHPEDGAFDLPFCSKYYARSVGWPRGFNGFTFREEARSLPENFQSNDSSLTLKRSHLWLKCLTRLEDVAALKGALLVSLAHQMRGGKWRDILVNNLPHTAPVPT